MQKKIPVQCMKNLFKISDKEAITQKTLTFLNCLKSEGKVLILKRKKKAKS